MKNNQLEKRLSTLEANQKWLIKLNWLIATILLANLIATITLNL